MRPRKTLVVVLASVNLVLTAWGGYGLYTQAGEPEFSRGGDFGAKTSEAAKKHASKSASRTAPKAKARAKEERRALKKAPARGNVRVSAGGVAVPRAGRYLYDSTGHEEVKFGFASACAWDLDGSSVDVKHDDDSEIFDWHYKPGRREERHIDMRRKDGIYSTFVGAAVTCANVQKTSEANYDPPAMRIPLPLRVGRTWQQSTRTEERNERITGKVLARKTVTVPAGRFDAYQVTQTGTVSDGQEGTYRSTFWFAPSLGMILEQHTEIDVRSGQAHFRSDITLRLRELPE